MFYSVEQRNFSDRFPRQNIGYIVGTEGDRFVRVARSGLPLFSFAESQTYRENYTIIPNLLTHPGSVLSVSVGPNVVRETKAYREQVLRQKIHVVDPYGVTGEPTRAVGYLDALDPDALCMDSAFLAQSLMQPFFDEQRANGFRSSKVQQLAPQQAADLASAVIQYVAQSPEVPEERRTLGSCATLLLQDGQAWKNSAADLFRYGESTKNPDMRQQGLQHYADPDSLLSRAAKEMAGTVVQPSCAVSHGHANLPLGDIADGKTTIYVVLPEGFGPNDAFWVRPLIDCAAKACNKMIDSEYCHDTLLPQERVLFMLDHFDAFGRLAHMEGGVSPAALKKGITYWGLAAKDQDVMEAYKWGGINVGNNAYVQHLDTLPDSRDGGTQMARRVRSSLAHAAVYPK